MFDLLGDTGGLAISPPSLGAETPIVEGTPDLRLERRIECEKCPEGDFDGDFAG